MTKDHAPLKTHNKVLTVVVWGAIALWGRLRQRCQFSFQYVDASPQRSPLAYLGIASRCSQSIATIEKLEKIASSQPIGLTSSSRESRYGPVRKDLV